MADQTSPAAQSTTAPAGNAVAPVELPVDLPGVPVDLPGLVREYYVSTYRYAYRLCGNQADAEDLTQQTFLVVQTKLHQVRERQKVQRWIFVVLRSCFLKSKRRTRPIAAANLELDVDEVPEHRITEQSFDKQDLQRALNDLPEEFRLVVLMFYFEDLTYQEIAEQLSLPIGTVMSRLARAKARLRRRLFDEVPASAQCTPRKSPLGSASDQERSPK
jgi:RNA polymerase sigma-70 factor (ECF subfamily)